MAGLVPAIHVFLAASFGTKTWMPGIRPGMTKSDRRSFAGNRVIMCAR
jgi:hypothetical protein